MTTTAVAVALDGIIDWLEAVPVSRPQASFTARPEHLASLAGRLARDATESASVATRERGVLVASAWSEHAALRGWDWAQTPDAVTVGSAATVTGAVRRWAVIPTAASVTALVVVAEPSQGALIWPASVAPPAVSRHALIGLAGLELLDLTDLAEHDAIVLDAADVPPAARAFADVLDAAVDLGIGLGFVQRVADYIAGRSILAEDDLSSVEAPILQQLGAAYADLGVISEGLRETVALAPGAAGLAREPGEQWAHRAEAHRRFSAPWLAAMLSDLFEAAGASATSGRFGLDSGWRDLTVRQTVFPPGGRQALGCADRVVRR
jgi:hypothetical protein